MKFYVGQRVSFRSQTSDHLYRGEIVRELVDGYYLVRDGTGLKPRCIHSSRLGEMPWPKMSGDAA